ncbi:hypothetical protein RIF23_05085 [Lipingzhangella sp. LS1_29]|uniref:Uncharacterized protein n=1 Tax=Lipingzhangella rawalii TaxID=2055835 RepID=A0ABU2H2Y5_9ACTN|nr:hypothetical protein [Lipingzhangella rawalii]MDS1269663.1 hypothetical protein [Lipingzhangella rawalii]
MTLERGNSGMSPAVASATMNWPWGVALLSGGVTGAISLLTSLSDGVLGAISQGTMTGIFFFALAGGAWMFLSGKGDRRARRYAGNHPWQVAAVPAGLGGAGVALVTYISAALGGALISGLFGALAYGVGVGAVLWLLLGIIAVVAGNKST